jgi:uncharacterized protein (UPF0262 family)
VKEAAMRAQLLRIVEISLDDEGGRSRKSELERERAAAISDLLSENTFAPVSGRAGPFHLRIGVEESRLNLHIRSAADGSIEMMLLSLVPFRRIVREYLLLCESYNEALRGSNLRGLEAIDLGRRALHNEGSERLLAELAPKVAVDHETARRLFTLISVLQRRG